MSMNPMLLQMLGNGNSPLARGDIDSLMQQQGAMSPKMKLMMQLLARNQQPAGADTDFDADGQDVDASAEESLRAKIERLEDELAEVEEMIDVFAEAVGACATCFGDMVDCPVCHGRGKPGCRLPDQRLFTHFVLPAVRRVNAESRESSESGSRQSPIVEGVMTRAATSPKLKGES